INVVAAWIVMGALFVAGVWSFIALEINFTSLISNFENAADFISRMFPLDFPPIGELVSLTLQTLAIVTLSTALAVALSLPVALMAASSTSPNKFAAGASRGFIVVMRAVPDLVLAII